jgi:CBS domain-containing protein
MGPCSLPPTQTGFKPAAAAASPMVERNARSRSAGWSVVWTRGEGCPELANLLAGSEAHRAGADLRTSCVEARADLLVGRKLTSFDLVGMAVPYGFDPAQVTGVAAAVAGGPHSLLAARVAQRLASALEVTVSLVAASADAGSDPAAEAALERVSGLVPIEEQTVLRAANPGAAVRALPSGLLLVLGAPGGTWWQRQFTGPGRQLRGGAPAGAVVVRRAPRRCFQQMEDPAAMGVQMPAGEARRLSTAPIVAVAEEGRLVGMVRRRDLEAADPAAPLGSLMEAPIFALAEDPLDAVAGLAAFLEGAPVPVVDGSGRLCGMVDAAAAPAGVDDGAF